MPPRLSQTVISLRRASGRPGWSFDPPICLFCSISRRSYGPRASPQFRSRTRVRQLSSSITSEPQVVENQPPRKVLYDALVDLNKNATSFVNISRLQLALRGLEQTHSHETVRIAILALTSDSTSIIKAKELARLLLANPLKPEEEWERSLVAADEDDRPILLKVGHGLEELNTSNPLVRELRVPSSNNTKFEILVLESQPELGRDVQSTDDILVPTINIPTSSTGRFTPVTTPVHKSIIFTQGIRGAASLISASIETSDIIKTVVDVRVSGEEAAELPFQVLDIQRATSALTAMRRRDIKGESDWLQSGIPRLSEWTQAGSGSDSALRAPLRGLISSLLENSSLSIDAEESRQLSKTLNSKVPTTSIDSLRLGLSTWAEEAHSELQHRLGFTFHGSRWQKLKWWKLFWRVDDVSMIATDILNQRFLTIAEKRAVFLAGRIEEAGVFQNLQPEEDKDWAYKPAVNPPTTAELGTLPPPTTLQALVEPEGNDSDIEVSLDPWPLQIPITRAYLSTETVPALQALAQNLVFQTLGTSSGFSALAGLMYLSSVSTGLYEAGGVAALGIVWSLRRMQGKWETGRKFWEGEVLEEGRKAVKDTENAFGRAFAIPNPPEQGQEDNQRGREAISRAEAALNSVE